MSDLPPPSTLPSEEPLPPRHDMWTAAVFFAIGVSVVWMSIQMPTFREQKGEIYTAPGLVPGLHGCVVVLLSLWLAARAWSRAKAGPAGTLAGAAPKREGYSDARMFGAAALCVAFAAGLVGRLPFWLAASIFVFAFTTLFEWRAGATAAERVRRLAIAASLGAGTGLFVTLVFEKVFLVRLP